MMQQAVADYFARFGVPMEVVSFVDRPIGHFIDGRETVATADRIDLLSNPLHGAG
jgi:phenylacetaldehyde dehydrogenase